MENMFSNDSRQFKFDILVQLCKQVYETGQVDEKAIRDYGKKLVSMDTPRVRCCVYKEREILRWRMRLAGNENASVNKPSKNIIQVNQL